MWQKRISQAARLSFTRSTAFRPRLTTGSAFSENPFKKIYQNSFRYQGIFYKSGKVQISSTPALPRRGEGAVAGLPLSPPLSFRPEGEILCLRGKRFLTAFGMTIRERKRSPPGGVCRPGRQAADEAIPRHPHPGPPPLGEGAVAGPMPST